MATKSNRSLILIIAIAALTVVALVALIVTRSGGSSAAPEPVPSASEQAAGQAESDGTESDESSANSQDAPPAPEFKQLVDSMARDQADDPLALGSLDAPVRLQVYFDFQCGYCAKAATESEPALQPYVDEGKVRIEYHPIAILGDESKLAAQAGYAAAAQGKFPEFHSYIFEQAVAGTPVTMTADGLTDAAKAAGIADLDKFKADMTSPEMVQAAQATHDAALNAGISATPSFLIGYTFQPGFLPADQMTQLVDAELARPTA